MDTTTIPPAEGDTRIADVDQAHIAALAEQQLADETADGLLSLAALIQANPALAPELRQAVDSMTTYVTDTGVLAAFARAVTRFGGTVRKEYPGPNDAPDRHFRLYGTFGPVELKMHCVRDLVCERVVVGVETVTEQVPDPELVAQVPLVEVTREVEKIEWECKPILAAAAPCPCGRGANCTCGAVGSVELAAAGTAVAR